jgi:Iron-sulfur cluster-binding domain
MSGENNPNQVLWIRESGPLCHIPWMGTVVVLSDGNVNFCCYSSAIVGNVHHQPLEEIWNGAEMVAIREELAAHRFPAQCRSMSCPIFRGDELTNLTSDFEPHSFRITGTPDPHRELRERLTGTGLREGFLEIRYRGAPLKVDLFVAVQQADGGMIRFLPLLEEFAVPWEYGVELREEASPARFKLPPWPGDARWINVALFATGTDPNRLSNCFWSEVQTLPAHLPGPCCSENG